MKTLLVLVVVATAAEARFMGHGKDGVWGYGDSNGPDTWPDLFPTCGGTRQSPVALITSQTIWDFTLKPFEFENYDHMPMTVTLTNTGHSVQVNMDVQASVAGGSLAGEYTFHQFHFHWGAADTRGSEHTVDNVRFPAELHLVHYRKIYGSWDEALLHGDGVAVVSIMLELSPTDNPNLQPIVNGLMEVIMPHEIGILSPFALQNILPNNVEDFFTYQGSLTTPGCNEVVTWTVFRDTITISSNQLKQFRELQAEDGSVLQDNYRTLQSLNGREVYRSWI